MSYQSVLEAKAGLAAYWRLNETSGTEAKDHKGTNTGTYAGAVLLNKEGPGRAAEPWNGMPGSRSAHFPGEEAAGVTLSQASALEPKSALSIALWMKPDTNTKAHIFSNMPPGTQKGHGYGIGQEVSGGLYFFVRNGSGFEPYLFTSGSVTTSLWYFVVGVWNGTSLVLYVNGAEVAKLTASVPATISAYTSCVPSIAVQHEYPAYKGNLEELALLNVALSAAEVKALYEAAEVGHTPAEATPYAQKILGTSGLMSYWRMNEAKGTQVYDYKGALNGTLVTISLPAWSGGTTYSAGYCIDKGGVIYESISSGNKGNEPPNATFWRVREGEQDAFYEQAQPSLIIDSLGKSLRVHGSQSAEPPGHYGVGVQIAAPESLEPTKELTVEMWVKPTTIGETAIIFFDHTSQVDGKHGWQILWEVPSHGGKKGEPKLIFLLMDGEEAIDGSLGKGIRTSISPLVSGLIKAGVKLHIVMTYKGGVSPEASIYINGKKQATEQFGSGSLATALNYGGATTKRPLFLADVSTTLGDYAFDGWAQETAVYERALTEVEVKEHYGLGLNIVPVVSGVAPVKGTGGTVVRITGENFEEVTAVTFGGVNATSFRMISATVITATAPPHAAGTVPVQVTTPGGTSSA